MTVNELVDKIIYKVDSYNDEDKQWIMEDLKSNLEIIASSYLGNTTFIRNENNIVNKAVEKAAMMIRFDNIREIKANLI